jgi:DNA-binding HxlR family transcriptional regulator
MKRPHYNQFCAAACALDLIGDRWTLLIVRELLYSPKRFTELLAGLPGIGTNTLTTRLAELTKSGIVSRRRISRPLPGSVIELTDSGRALEPVLVALVHWGTAPLLARRPRHGLRPAWVGLALRSFFCAAKARGPRMRVALHLGKGALLLELGAGKLRIVEGEPPPEVELRITTREPVLLDVLRGALSLAAAKRRRVLTVEGDASQLPRLLAAFPIGPPAQAAGS